MSDGELILVAGLLLAAGIAASLLAAQVRLPGLLLFLGLGMLIGSDGLGWIEFGDTQGDYELARTIGIVALVLILFEGGLTAGFDAIRPVLRPALGLALVGTFVTAAITGLAAAWLFDLDLLEGLLLGSIVASTDGAAIFSILRGSTLRRRLAHTLEGEAGFNDPVAVLLVIGFIEWIQEPDFGVADMLGLFAMELGIGALAGIAVGWLAVKGLRRARLDTPGLYPVATLATAAVAFGAADFLHGSGFLAVYLAGLALGSARDPGPAHGHRLPPGARLGGSDHDVPVARAARVPQRARRRLDRGHRAHARAAVRRPPAGDLRSERRSTPSPSSERDGAGLGRPARGGAGGARDLPGDRRRGRGRRLLQHRLLRGGDLHAAAGRDLRATGRSAWG